MNKFLPLILILFAGTSLFPVLSYAQKLHPDSEEGKEFNEASYEMVICSSFYSVMNAALKNTEWEGAGKAADDMNDLSLESLLYAYVFAKQTRTEEMAKKVTDSRFKIEYNNMHEEINNNYSNGSILMEKHLDNCTAALKEHRERYN